MLPKPKYKIPPPEYDPDAPRCEACPHFAPDPPPPENNSGTCAELRRLKLEVHVTVPGRCVIAQRKWLKAEAALWLGKGKEETRG